MEADATSTRESTPLDAPDSNLDLLALPGHRKRLKPDIRRQVDDWEGMTSWRRTWTLFLAERDEFWWQVVASVVVVAYVGSLVVVSRPTSGYNSFWHGWIGNIDGMVPLIPIVLRLRRSSRRRGAWTALAVGIVLYNVVNILYLLHDQNVVLIPSPAPSDVPHLLSYVAFVVGVVLMTQHRYGRGLESVRLDSAVAGLSIAAVAALFWFNQVLVVSGRPLQVIVGKA